MIPSSPDLRLNTRSPLARGLVGWWPTFRSPSQPESARDKSFYYHDAVQSNMDGTEFEYKDGRRAFYYPGTTAYKSLEIARSNSMELQGALSVALWVNIPTGGGNGAKFFAKSYTSRSNPFATFDVDKLTSNSVRFALGTPSLTTLTSSTTIPLDQWVLITARWNGATMSLDFNGVNKGTASKSGTLTYYDTPFTIGGPGWGTGTVADWMTGHIGDVAYWSRDIGLNGARQLYADPFLLYDDSTNFYAFDAAAAGGTTIPIFHHHYNQMRA